MMDAENLLSVFESVAMARLRPGDVLLFRCSGQLHASTRAHIVEMLNEVFPNHESIILEGGQDIAVLRPEPGFIDRLFRK
jgi:hypothetical protein